MSSPLDPAAEAAVQAQLAAQAQSFDDAAPATPALDLTAAKAVAVDAQALLERIQAVEAQQAAAEAAANPPPPEPDTKLYVDSNAPGWLHNVIGKIEDRLAAGGL